MRRVRGEAERPVRRFHLDHLKPARMAADPVHARPRRHLSRPVMEHHAPRMDVAHHLADMG